MLGLLSRTRQGPCELRFGSQCARASFSAPGSYRADLYALIDVFELPVEVKPLKDQP
jgi:hypothetical protein